ncbi:hypothetical protein PIROE2DRAFT_6084 [Piromyces sp. E2]|nr:hypothetical protein PIROE2DRAFT_6084 [Piromyces sp. E2]|eukprot:OUM66664.1 hypothetical protein PIROE2DRAFT_6084 [Piromyces sp. E2]
MYIKNSQPSTNILENFPRKNVEYILNFNDKLIKRKETENEKDKKEKEKEDLIILETLYNYKNEEKLPYCFVYSNRAFCYGEHKHTEGVEYEKYNKYYKELLKHYTPPEHEIYYSNENEHELEPEPEPEPEPEIEPEPEVEDEPDPEHEHYKDNKNNNKYNNNTKPKKVSTDLKWDSIPQNNGSNNSTAKTIDHLNKYNDHGNNNISHTGAIDNSNNIKKESSSFIKFNSVTISIIALIVIGSTLFAYRKRIHSMIIKNKYKNKNENDLKLLTVYTDFDDDGINKQSIFTDVGYISKQNQNISTNSINNITTTTNNNNNYDYDYDYNYNDNNKIEISKKDSVKSPKLAVLTNSNFSLNRSLSRGRKQDISLKGTFSRGIKQDSNIKRTLSRCKKQNIDIRISTMTDKEDIDMIRDYIRSSSPTRSPTRSLNRSPTKSPTLSINRSPIMSPKMSYSLPRMNNHISDLTNTLPRVNNKQEYTSNSNDYNEEKYNFSLDYISSLRKFDLDVNNFNNNTLQRNMMTQDVDSSTIYSKYTDKY